MPAQRHTHDTYSNTLDTIPASSGTSRAPVVTTRTGRLIIVNPAALDQSLPDYLPTGDDTRQPSQTTSPTTDVQTQLPIINLKDLGATSVDCLLALRSPKGYVPKTLEKSGSQGKPKAKKGGPNSFLVFRSVNNNALFETLAGAAPSDIQDMPNSGTERTTSCSKIMSQIWWHHMTKEQRDVYAARSASLKPLYEERCTKSDQNQSKNGKRRVQVENSGSSRKATSLRKNAGSKEPMEHPKRAAVSSKPRRTTRSRKQARTSQGIVSREVPHLSSDGINQTPSEVMNDAAQSSVHRHAYDDVPFQSVSFSPYSNTHQYQNHHFSGAFRRRQPFSAELYHGASPYVYDMHPPSSQHYNLRQTRSTGFTYAASSTIPRISATSRRVSHGSINVACHTTNLDSSYRTQPLRVVTENLFGLMPAPGDSLRQYQPSQNDDYVLVDPQLLAMSNEGSSAANGGGLAQRGHEANVFRHPT
ncbi:hypothetical protein NMY22_g2730 [Coprinellus aureogranulatus]|nr:hypothetical protein NMY22_g2730 [Coprinellus aureogranulatus]